MKTKFYISSQVHDKFRELTNEEKWTGLKGEFTTATGFTFWERLKTTNNKTFSINSTKKQQTK